MWGTLRFVTPRKLSVEIGYPTQAKERLEWGTQRFSSALALALLVLRVLANHPHHSAAMDDLALVTNLFY
jgi:hypothetical protein